MDSQLSKSEKKRRAKAVEQLVHELAALTSGQIASLPCDEELREEIAAAKDLKSGARKRQLKYATKLLRDAPIEELYAYLAQKKGSTLKEKKEFHELEHFRNILLNEAVQVYEDMLDDNGYLSQNEPVGFLENSEAIKAIVVHLPEVDQTALKSSAIQYAKSKNRKFSREIFRIMKAAKEKAQFS